MLQAKGRAGDGMGREVQVLEERVQTQYGLAQRALAKRSGQPPLAVVESHEVCVHHGAFCLLGFAALGFGWNLLLRL